MIIDCHFHLDEGMITQDALIAKMDAAGVDRVGLMAFLSEPIPVPAPFLVSMLQFFLVHRWLRGLGKLMAGSFTKEGDIKTPIGIFRVFKDPDNEPVFRAVKAHPRRFHGWAFVNPEGDRNPLEELDKWKKHPGFIGVKAHPFWHRYPPAELVPVAMRLAPLGKPLLIHAGFGEHGDFESLLRRVPNLKLILAHAGFPRFADTWKKIKEHPNVYVDLSQTSYVGERTMRRAVDFLGPERCVYGTDGPYGPEGDDGAMDYGLLKRRVEKLFPDDEMKRKILGDSFAAIAGIR